MNITAIVPKIEEKEDKGKINVKRKDTEIFHTGREERRTLSGKKELITFKVPEDQMKEMQEMARRIQTTVTEIVIMAIKEFVENEIAYEIYKKTRKKWKVRFVEEERDE